MVTPTTLLLPKGCSDFYASRVGRTYYYPNGTTATITFTVYAENEAQKIKFNNPADFNYESNGDGTVRVELGSPVVSQVGDTVACVYDVNTMQDRVDFDKCHLAGYGVASASDLKYTGTLTTTPIKKRVGNPCCSKVIQESQFESEASVTVTTEPHLRTVCLTPDSGETCMGDQGSPIYCQADTGDLVLVALVGGYSCAREALFVAIDKTGGVFASIHGA